jgi:hypothetical protein
MLFSQQPEPPIEITAEADTMKRTPLTLVLCILLLPLTACATEPPAKVGRVLEAGTNKPIAGAIVLARWKGFMPAPGHGSTLCYHVESTVTNAEGVYRISAWHEDLQHAILQDKTIYIDAYKSGYVRSPEFYKQQSYRQGIELMEGFKGTREERLKYLERLEQSIRVCRSPEAGERNLLPFYRALHAEADSIALTPNEWRIVDGFLTDIDIIELGYKEGLKRGIERVEKRRQQP